MYLAILPRRMFVVWFAANAKTGDGANFGIPSESERDAALGSRADTYGDYSRANSEYQKNRQPVDMVAKKKLLVAAFERIDAKVEPAIDLKRWPAVTDALNAELYGFKSLLTQITRGAQGGKLCLVDPSQRGPTMPSGFDPDDCPLQKLQIAILQDVNDLFRVASTTKDKNKASSLYRAFQKDVAGFVANVPDRAPLVDVRLDLSY